MVDPQAVSSHWEQHQVPQQKDVDRIQQTNQEELGNGPVPPGGHLESFEKNNSDHDPQFDQFVNQESKTSHEDYDGFEQQMYGRGLRHQTKEVSAIARRDRYLNDLVKNSVGSRTNFINKHRAFDVENPPRLGALRKVDPRTEDTMESKDFLEAVAASHQRYMHENTSQIQSFRNQAPFSGSSSYQHHEFQNTMAAPMSTRQQATDQACAKPLEFSHRAAIQDTRTQLSQRYQSNESPQLRQPRRTRNLIGAILKSTEANRSVQLHQANFSIAKVQTSSVQSPRALAGTVHQGFTKNSRQQNGILSRSMAANHNLLSSFHMQVNQQQMRRPYQRKLSPLARQEPRIINITDYRTYADETGVVPLTQKIEAVEHFEIQEKLKLLTGNQEVKNEEEKLGLKERNRRTRDRISGLRQEPNYSVLSYQKIISEMRGSSQITNKHQQSKSPRADSNQSWVHVPVRDSEATNQHKMRKKDQEDLQVAIKQAEVAIREKRRAIDQIQNKLAENIAEIDNQITINQKVMRFEKLNQPSLHSAGTDRHPTGSIYEESLAETESVPNLELHSLYNGLIKNDFQAVTQRTHQQCDIFYQSKAQIAAQIGTLRASNAVIKKSIKFYADSIEGERDRKREQRLWKDDRASEFGLSMSFSQSGVQSAMGGMTNFDIARVEKINKHVQEMIQSKSAFDCALAVIGACKEAFKNVTRSTLFIVNPYLQALLLQVPKIYQKNMRQIALEDSPTGTMLAIFFSEEQYCAPCFREPTEGCKLVFSQRLISVPALDEDEKLVFTLQVEADVATEKQAVQSASLINVQQGLNSFQNKTRMSFGQTSTMRARTAGWRSTDLTVARMISTVGHCRFEVFADHALVQKKHNTQKQVIQFVNKFCTHKSYKEILKSIKHEVPKLLGFSSANIYLSDAANKLLLALSVDEEAERLAMIEDPTSFEREFYFDQNQIVKFPTNMGLSGFAFQKDGIIYINGLDRAQDKGAAYAKPTGICHAIAKHEYSSLAKKLLSPSITKGMSFNNKIDNFIDVKNIQNVVMSSIQDEHVLHRVCPVGVLQLYNKIGGEIGEDDLSRIFYIRKLIGAATVRCEYTSMTLQTVLGLYMERDKLIQSKESVEEVHRKVYDGPSSAFHSLMATIKRPIESACQANTDSTEQNMRVERIGKNIQKKFLSPHMIQLQNKKKEF